MMTGPASIVFEDRGLDESFKRDGYAVIRLLAADEIADLLLTLDRFADHQQDDFNATLLSPDLQYRRIANDEVGRVLAPRVASVVRDYRLVCSGFAVKPPARKASAMPLHQDITMVKEGGRPAISLWAPLVDVGPGNGCLEVVAGSHLLSRGPRAPGTAFIGRQVEADIRARYLRPLPLRAGQAVLIDQAVFHASPPNTSAASRPVAVSVIAPREQPLVYYHRHATGGAVRLEEFQVADDFFVRHLLGTRPEQGRSLGFIEETQERLSPAALTMLL